jgi:hypothetical protein
MLSARLNWSLPLLVAIKIQQLLSINLATLCRQDNGEFLE